MPTSHVIFDLPFPLPTIYAAEIMGVDNLWLVQFETHAMKKNLPWHFLEGQYPEARQPRDLDRTKQDWQRKVNEINFNDILQYS